MSDRERTGHRDLLYSRWHRADQVARYIGLGDARRLKTIDVDSCEWCARCQTPLVLIETKNSERSPAAFVTQTRVTAQLARMAGISAFCVTYTCVCGITRGHQTAEACDINRFQRLQVEPAGDDTVYVLTPAMYAGWLRDLHEGCEHTAWGEAA